MVAIMEEPSGGKKDGIASRWRKSLAFLRPIWARRRGEQKLDEDVAKRLDEATGGKIEPFIVARETPVP